MGPVASSYPVLRRGYPATQEGVEVTLANTCKSHTVHTWNCCTDSALAVEGIGLRSTK